MGLEHPSTLTSMANLTSTYRNQGRWKETEELEVQVTETSSKVLELEHPDTLTSVANLASTFWSQGRWKEAEELFVQVVETSSRVLGVGVNKIIRIDLSTEGHTSPYIHETLSWYRLERDSSRSFETPPGHTC